MPSLKLPLIPGWSPIRVPCISNKEYKQKVREKMKEKTMDPKHEARVDELIDEMGKVIKANCVKLYKSGGIDVESYTGSGFALAKVLD